MNFLKNEIVAAIGEDESSDIESVENDDPSHTEENVTFVQDAPTGVVLNPEHWWCIEESSQRSETI